MEEAEGAAARSGVWLKERLSRSVEEAGPEVVKGFYVGETVNAAKELKWNERDVIAAKGDPATVMGPSTMEGEVLVDFKMPRCGGPGLEGCR